MADEPRRVTNGKTVPFRGLAWLVAGLLLALMSLSGPAFAKPVASSIMVDAVTGEIISSSNSDVSTYPASLTKMMTLYLLFDALKHGQIKLTDSIVFSDHAAAQDATNLAVSEGASIKVETAILAVVVRDRPLRADRDLVHGLRRKTRGGRTHLATKRRRVSARRHSMRASCGRRNLRDDEGRHRKNATKRMEAPVAKTRAVERAAGSRDLSVA